MPVKAYNTRLLVDEFDFSADTAGLSLSLAAEAIEAPALQSSAAQYIGGNAKGTIEQNGYWNGGAAGLIDDEIYARLGSETPCIVTVAFDTTAVGNPAYVQQSTWASQMNIEAPVDGLLSVANKFEDMISRGYVVAHGTISATGGQTVIDFGAAGADGAWAVLHVTAISGTATNATFTVQHATTVGFGSPATLITLANVSDVGAQVATATGSVNRYIRLNCTSLGGATSLSVTAIVGVTGVTG